MLKRSLPSRRLHTIEEVAVATGLPVKRLTKLAVRSGMPRVVLDNGCHRYDLDDVVAFLKARFGEGQNRAAADG